VIALDMPGFGQSYAPPERLPLPDYGAVVADFIRQLDLRNLAVAGFSFGTLVAATVAGLLPDVVTALTLINPPGIGERSAHALALPEELAAIARQQGLHAGVEATLKQVMLSDPALADDALISLIAGCVRHTHFETRSISRRADMLALLEKAPRNTLVLLGRQDPYHCHDLDGRRDRLNRLLGRDAVRLVDHAAHWLQYEQAAFFNRTLMDFLEAPPD
jgi:pimeloyl-ACP methyl ester carboxylesterase